MEVYSKEELLSKLQVADKKVLFNVTADFPIISKNFIQILHITNECNHLKSKAEEDKKNQAQKEQEISELNEDLFELRRLFENISCQKIKLETDLELVTVSIIHHRSTRRKSFLHY